ncbi:MAG: signal recognition particle-docking protein FtsY, partial [Planctomycetes bacterium]|nr:signal recognition particle-docking protein FtsY [Planctomycetota bacterium]
EDLLQRLEEVLVTADVGIRTAERLLSAIRDRASREELSDAAALRRYLGEEASALLAGRDQPLVSPPPAGPLVIMVVGVNGTGKTTTIGKLASRYSREGKKVMLAAGDTFRAAAIEQLEIWAERAGAEIVRQQEGSDPSAVIFDAVKAASARGFDVLIADTAGRLHTKAPLMDELRKVKRVTDRALPG